MRDYYATLGVPRYSSIEVVKHAYRGLVKSLHPDAGGDLHRFLAVQQAYEVLSGTQKLTYDHRLREMEARAQQRPSEPYHSPRQTAVITDEILQALYDEYRKTMEAQYEEALRRTHSDIYRCNIDWNNLAKSMEEDHLQVQEDRHDFYMSLVRYSMYFWMFIGLVLVLRT